jgi:serine/threonine-protein kinase
VLHRDPVGEPARLVLNGGPPIRDLGLTQGSAEAALGQEVDHRTDIFAVGIILWELLTGQRLFLGETDFQTVKKVQQAVVPPVRQFNSKVTPELEAMVMRSLAKEPAQRYPTARDFGKELVRYLFSMAVPISTFDIELLVHGAMRDRQKTRPQQHSIIDKLIEEALLEFTSLKEEQPGQPRRDARGPSPLNLGEFEDTSAWINELAANSDRLSAEIHDPMRSSLPPDLFTPGNLSALEETAMKPEPARIPTPAALMSASNAAQQPPAPQRPFVPPGAPAALAGAVGAMPVRGADARRQQAMIAVVVVLALIFAGMIAWYIHIIPH